MSEVELQAIITAILLGGKPTTSQGEANITFALKTAKTILKKVRNP